MASICDNPKCQFHVPCPWGLEDRPIIRVELPSTELATTGYRQVIKYRDVMRRPYRTPVSACVLFYLCDVCHNAVEMTRPRHG